MDLQKLFNHMAENYDLILLDTEMFEIIDIVKEIISDAQAESPTVGDNEDKRLKCDVCGKHPSVIIITEFGTYCKEHARYV